MPDTKVLQFTASSFLFPNSGAIAAPNAIVGTNGVLEANVFLNTDTDPKIRAQRMLPDEIDITGNVTFDMYLDSISAQAAPNNLAGFFFKHNAKGNAQGWDAAFTSLAIKTATMEVVTKDFTKFSFVETLASLGWTSLKFLMFTLERDNTISNNSATGIALAELDITIDLV